MKNTTLSELKDELIGIIGNLEREKYEQKLSKEVGRRMQPKPPTHLPQRKKGD